MGGPGDICATSGDALVLGTAFGDNPGPDERFQVASRNGPVPTGCSMILSP